MNLLTKRKRIKTYIGEDLKDKYLYFCVDEKKHKHHYIVHLTDIIFDNTNVTYIVDKGKVLKVPYNKEQKCYIFETSNEIDINTFNVDVYDLKWEEYIELFRKFIEYEGIICKDVPENFI